MIALAFGFLWLFKKLISSPAGRSRLHRFLLSMPVFSSLYIKVNMSRFASTLSTLLSSGVELLAALDISKNIVHNLHIAKAIEAAREGVKEGKSLAQQLGKEKFFPKMLLSMISIGEQSGDLENMLTKAAKAYENEVNAAIAGITSLIEPLMIIVLGGIVFSIVISILLPMVDLINLVQK